jgi:hypothetical protein
MTFRLFHRIATPLKAAHLGPEVVIAFCHCHARRDATASYRRIKARLLDGPAVTFKSILCLLPWSEAILSPRPLSKNAIKIGLSGRVTHLGV